MCELYQEFYFFSILKNKPNIFGVGLNSDQELGHAIQESWGANKFCLCLL